MFKKTKTRIIFQPEAERLEVPVIKKPKIKKPQEIVGINSAEVETRYKNFILGVVIDYNRIEYDFEWDTRNRRLAKLTGKKVTPIVWQLASDYLTEFFAPPPPPPAPVVKEQPPIQPVVVKEKIEEPVIIPEPQSPLVELELSDEEIFANARKFLETGINLDPMEV